MSNTVITVESVSKRYLVGHRFAQRRGYTALRDVIAREARNFARKAVDAVRGQQIVQGDVVEEFWALKDVSFEVKRGEVLGIIGSNGAGKSTLLKVLSRITEPTQGRIKIKGRVGSLLEVGTGFHPEMSGRENVYLNGAILGMTKAEIRKKFDEIVAFADVENFIDTPVKHYSSGMYLRLAFAVAAHFEPEILIVDEVLAVGDFEFQKKCLGKIGEVAGGGRTVLFVSHNMGAVQVLCRRGLLLAHGQALFNGDIQATVANYVNRLKRQSRVEFEPSKGRPSITAVSMDQDELKNGNLVVDIEFSSPFPLAPPVPGIVISSNLGTPVYGSNPRFHNRNVHLTSLKAGVLRMDVQGLPLVSDNYRLSVWLGDWQTNYDQKSDILSFDFRPETALSTRPEAEGIGYLEWPATWRIL